jgi:predicted transcriptional regulator of viral defense system
MRTLSDFLQTHQIFTTAELIDGLSNSAQEYKAVSDPQARKSLLSYHVAKGHLLSIRRGIYWTVPPGMSPDTCPVDPFLVASRLAPDAVLGYHTALAFHGVAYSQWNMHEYLTDNSNIPVFSLRGATYKAVSQPATLRRKKMQVWEVETFDRLGCDVRVTSLERTFVDALDRLDLCGGYEEVWPCLEMIQYLKLKQVGEYALVLENSTLMAKIGFFLEQHKEQFEVADEFLQTLHAHRPRQPHRVLSGNKDGKLVSKWNLIVPASAITRSWEESSWQ